MIDLDGHRTHSSEVSLPSWPRSRQCASRGGRGKAGRHHQAIAYSRARSSPLPRPTLGSTTRVSGRAAPSGTSWGTWRENRLSAYSSAAAKARTAKTHYEAAQATLRSAEGALKAALATKPKPKAAGTPLLDSALIALFGDPKEFAKEKGFIKTGPLMQFLASLVVGGKLISGAASFVGKAVGGVGGAIAKTLSGGGARSPQRAAARTIQEVADDVPAYARSRYGRVPVTERAGALERTPTCPYCGQNPSSQVDHIVSLRRDWGAGGWADDVATRTERVNDPGNLIGACQPCNKAKGASPLGEGPGEFWPPAWPPGSLWPFGR